MKLSEKVMGLRNTDWSSQNSPRDAKYGVGNIANTIVIPMYSSRWVLVQCDCLTTILYT